MTLHEAILAVIRKNPQEMRARDIAQEINKYSLFKPKGDKLVTPDQIIQSVNKYQQSVATIVDTEIGKWCEEAVNDMESLSLKHSLEHSENKEEDGLPGKVQ